jgi:hypothetical protein
MSEKSTKIDPKGGPGETNKKSGIQRERSTVKIVGAKTGKDEPKTTKKANP